VLRGRRIRSPAQSSSGEKQTPTAARLLETQWGKRIEIHHEITAISIQPCSKASNESANPDNVTIRIMRKSSEIERNETDIIIHFNKQMQTRTDVLTNVVVPATLFRLRQETAPRPLPTERGRPIQRT
jgi:hypothetical protein